MSKKKIVFCCDVSDEFYYSMGADKLVRSAKYFHPDIPFVVFGTKEVEALGVPREINTPFILNKLIDEYDMVVRFDADSMIVGDLHRIFKLFRDGYEVLGVRNNNDAGLAGIDPPIAQFNVSVDRYLNTGLIATNSKRFIEEWMDINLSVGTMLPFVGQTTLNAIVRKYKLGILDERDKDWYFGTSCLEGDGTDTQTHWDSWKKIEIKDGLYLNLNKKIIKVLHHAGGFKPDKMGLYMFNEQTRKRLIEIIA